MKVAVVGPTGILGRALIPLLLDQGYQVRALARSMEKAKHVLPETIEIARCDLLASDIEKTLAPNLRGCDAVIHMATAIPQDFSIPHAWDANTRLRTDGVRILLDAALQAGIRQYIQQSITMAYPDCGDDWIAEDTPLDTSGNRAMTSGPVIAMEAMIRSIPSDRLHWSILRGGSFVGPGTFQDRLVEGIRANKEIIPCDGRNYVSLIHLSDMASAVAAALKQAPPGSTFNIVDQPLRQSEYYDRLAASVTAPKPRRDGTLPCPPSWRCDNQHAQAVLHWQPIHSIIPS